MTDTALFCRYLLVMAGVTYLIRMLPFVLCKRRIANRFVRSFLMYMPYAVLGADGTAAIDEVLYDTKAPYLLHAYQEGIGALQDFVPAK